MRGADNIILAIYNKFKCSLFYEMKEHKLEKCIFYDYKEYHPDYGRFYFQTTNALGDNPTCNIAIAVYKFGYEYYDKLVDVFKSHAGWLFEIGEYDYDTDTFDIRFIVFKKPIYSGVKKECYRISIDGIDTLYKYNKNVNPDFDLTSHLGLPSLPTFKFDSPFSDRIPTLSKPPIFNPPATICYWNDGTRTVVKCQEGDIYSPEAGLALCYMKKILGNTSRDLNKELHKYIPEEKGEDK